jgi:predicted nucleic acid-binding protein
LIVLDASAVVDLLLDLAPHAGTVSEIVTEYDRSLYAPHLLDAEVGQVLRRLVLAGKISVNRADQALSDLSDLPIQRFAHGPLMKPALALLRNVTIYDALYLMLAQATDSTLITRDKALERIAGCKARVRVLR